MIITIAVEKAFDKVQHLFVMKDLKKSEIGKYLPIIKTIYNKPIVFFTSVTVKGRKLKAFPPKLAKSAHCPHYS